MCYTHTHTHRLKYYSAFKKKEILPFRNQYILKHQLHRKVSRPPQGTCELQESSHFRKSKAMPPKLVFSVHSTLLGQRQCPNRGNFYHMQYCSVTQLTFHFYQVSRLES